MEIKVYKEVELEDYVKDYEHNFWSGAYDRLRSLDEHNKLDKFIDYLIANADLDCNEIKDVEFNDYIWFDCDDIIQKLENEDNEEEDEEED